MLAVLLVCVAGFLSGCSGSKLIKNPVPLETAKSLEQVSDQRITASLQWVIVRDGPGTWAKNANWDEYLLSVHNQTGEDIQVTTALLMDSMGFQHRNDFNQRRLANASRESIKRYKDVDISYTAGKAEGALLIAAGVGAGFLINAAVDATIEAALTNSVTTASSIGIAAGMVLVVAPILIVAGITQGINNHEVSAEMDARHTALPVTVAPNATLKMNLFFPIVPSPQRIDIGYSGAFGERVISLDTTEVLDGLHIDASQTREKSVQ